MDKPEVTGETRLLRVHMAGSVLLGRAGHVHDVREERFFNPQIQDFETGLIEFYMTSGNIIDLFWDSRFGIIADKVEVVEDA